MVDADQSGYLSWCHGFNEANKNSIWFSELEILIETCWDLTVWFGYRDFSTIRSISRAQKIGLNFRLLPSIFTTIQMYCKSQCTVLENDCLVGKIHSIFHRIVWCIHHTTVNVMKAFNVSQGENESIFSFVNKFWKNMQVYKSVLLKDRKTMIAKI